MAKVGGQLPSLEIAALQPPDGSVGVVVPYDPHGGALVLDGGGEHRVVHEKGAVAADRDAGAVGSGALGAEPAGHAEAHRSEPHGTAQDRKTVVSGHTLS